MQITDELIMRLESLSRIELTSEQRENTKNDLQKILTYIESLSELDTASAEPLSHSSSVTNVMREDEVKESTDRDLILSNAPNQADGCFSVHKTVE